MEGLLLVRPLPLRGEGLRGYLLRVADANGLLPDLDLFRALRGRAGRSGSPDLVAIANAGQLGLDTSEMTSLGCFGPVRGETRCQHVRHKIALQHLRAQQAAVCPRCLVAQPAIWADWELLAQVVCPDHGCWLIDACPRCGQALRWRRAGLCTCGCGFDLRRAKTTPAPVGVRRLAAALRHRLFADLSTGSMVDSSMPEFIWRCPLNELLGLFHLFRASRLRRLIGPPPDLVNATEALREQAAVAIEASGVADAWPERWHGMLDALRLSGGGAADHQVYSLVTAREALKPYAFLRRSAWSPAAEFPKELRKESEAMLRDRRIFVGPRRFFVGGSVNLRARQGYSAQLRYLLTTRAQVRRAECADKLSRDALQELFDASDHQWEVLRKLGVVRSAAWVSLSEADLGMGKLGVHARILCPSTDLDVVPLAEFSVERGDEFEQHLRNVMDGRTPSVYRGSFRIPSLRNLFIPSSFTRMNGLSEFELKRCRGA